MNLIRLFSFLTIFGLLFLTTTGKRLSSATLVDRCFSSSSSSVVRGTEDKIEADVEVDEDEEPLRRAEETVTPASDVLVNSSAEKRNSSSIELICRSGGKRRRGSEPHSVIARFSNRLCFYSTTESNRCVTTIFTSQTNDLSFRTDRWKIDPFAGRSP